MSSGILLQPLNPNTITGRVSRHGTSSSCLPLIDEGLHGDSFMSNTVYRAPTVNNSILLTPCCIRPDRQFRGTYHGSSFYSLFRRGWVAGTWILWDISEARCDAEEQAWTRSKRVLKYETFFYPSGKWSWWNSQLTWSSFISTENSILSMGGEGECCRSTGREW